MYQRKLGLDKVDEQYEYAIQNLLEPIYSGGSSYFGAYLHNRFVLTSHMINECLVEGDKPTHFEQNYIIEQMIKWYMNIITPLKQYFEIQFIVGDIEFGYFNTSFYVNAQLESNLKNWLEWTSDAIKREQSDKPEICDETTWKFSVHTFDSDLNNIIKTNISDVLGKNVVYDRFDIISDYDDDKGVAILDTMIRVNDE